MLVETMYYLLSCVGRTASPRLARPRLALPRQAVPRAARPLEPCGHRIVPNYLAYCKPAVYTGSMARKALVSLADAAIEVGLSTERLRQLIHAHPAGWGAERDGRRWLLPRSVVERLKREPRPKPGPKGPRRRVA